MHRASSPRAFLAWESHDGPNPLPRWKRYCGGCAWFLLGASERALDENEAWAWLPRYPWPAARLK